MKPLDISPEMHGLPIDRALKEACGLDPETRDSDLQMVQVTVDAASYGGNWRVNASVAVDGKPEESTFVGSMWCDPGTPRDQVLAVAGSWIRGSEAVAFAPGRIVETPIQDEAYALYAVSGVTLVRGLLA